MSDFNLQCDTIITDNGPMDLLKIDRTSLMSLMGALDCSIDQITQSIKKKSISILLQPDALKTIQEIDDLNYLVFSCERMCLIYNKLIDDFFPEKKDMRKSTKMYEDYAEINNKVTEEMKKILERMEEE